MEQGSFGAVFSGGFPVGLGVPRAPGSSVNCSRWKLLLSFGQLDCVSTHREEIREEVRHCLERKGFPLSLWVLLYVEREVPTRQEEEEGEAVPSALGGRWEDDGKMGLELGQPPEGILVAPLGIWPEGGIFET